jgi:hypothetical protein
MARKRIAEVIGKDKVAAEKIERVHFLMDFRSAKMRYEQQEREAIAREIAAGRLSPQRS